MTKSQALKLEPGQRVGCRWPGRKLPVPLTIVSVGEDSVRGVVMVRARNDRGQVSDYNHRLLVALT